MFFDDILLVKTSVEKYGHVDGHVVEAGGLARPCVADYSMTIERMKLARSPEEVRDAQVARYRNIDMPLSFLGSYIPEDPSVAGGVSIEGLAAKYPKAIGCLVCLSTLEHVDEPWYAPEQMHDACRPGALVIVSVPWIFPHHPSPQDHWRFSPTGLDILFRSPTDGFEKLESGWRLDIPADAGVMDIHTGRPQAIQSAYWVGRVR